MRISIHKNGRPLRTEASISKVFGEQRECSFHLQKRATKDVAFKLYIRKLRKNRTWARVAAAVFICMRYAISLVLVRNTKMGLICNNIHTLKKINFIEESALAIYMYHHMYKKLFIAFRVCDYYTLLSSYKEANPGESFEIYRNPYIKNKSSPSDLLPVPSSNDDTTVSELPRSKQQKIYYQKESKKDEKK